MKHNGFSTFEYLAALIITMIAFISWLQLTVTAVQNGTFVKQLADVGMLSSSKASEVLQDSEKVFANLPPSVNSIGAIAPHPVVDGYYDLLDSSGQPVTSYQSKSEIRFIRQWVIIRDIPSKGSYSVFVSVLCPQTHRVLRLANATKFDGIQR